MSGMSEDQALELGHECAMTALKAEREHVAVLPPAERLYWWFGFLTAALGAANASLGEPATRALRAALADSPESLTARPRRARGEPQLSVVSRGTYGEEADSGTKRKA